MLFLCYYKMLNLGQSGFNCLKGDQIKIYCKKLKRKPCTQFVDTYYGWKVNHFSAVIFVEIGSNHYRADRRRLR